MPGGLGVWEGSFPMFLLYDHVWPLGINCCGPFSTILPPSQSSQSSQIFEIDFPAELNSHFAFPCRSRPLVAGESMNPTCRDWPTACDQKARGRTLAKLESHATKHAQDARHLNVRNRTRLSRHSNHKRNSDVEQRRHSLAGAAPVDGGRQ